MQTTIPACPCRRGHGTRAGSPRPPVLPLLSTEVSDILPPTLISPLNANVPVEPDEIADLIALIRESADKLHADRIDRGDLKILSRTIRELRYAFKVFAAYRGRRKVTVFGSARTPSDAPAYQQALQLGKAMAQRQWLVVTGAASGIMEAGHRGAGREHSMGLNIMLPFEQSANEIIRGDEKLVNMKYFFTRKLMFVKECDAVVCLPGGFGTLDEALEVLTLLQTGKRDMVPVVLLDEPGGAYWHDFHKFVDRHLLRTAMISDVDFSLYTIYDNVERAVEEIMHFYRVYSGMRYIRKQLVFRLQRPLSDDALAEVNQQFADLLARGQFVQRDAFKEEADDFRYAGLPRLAFHFNRRNYGRLRQLIDAINASQPPAIEDAPPEKKLPPP
ncbi:MAG: TIGR00730 family Rossman fold protein [Pirellulales bacterium]|nr:TIGR00730 family Rossman fold protein [Pirellulales bacterium]